MDRVEGIANVSLSLEERATQEGRKKALVLCGELLEGCGGEVLVLVLVVVVVLVVLAVVMVVKCAGITCLAYLLALSVD